MNSVRTHLSSLRHLFYPHLCAGCGIDLFEPEIPICHDCLHDLPETCFEQMTDHPVKRLFEGRVRLEFTHAAYYFSKGKTIQRLMHQLKYKGNSEVGVVLGEQMGKKLCDVMLVQTIDYLIPMPLHPAKMKIRGYNQAERIAMGLGKTLQIEVMDDNLVRERNTGTQTNKNRMERWLNVEHSFQIKNPHLLESKHVMLIDDVLTTGASLEACAQVIQKIGDVKISIATLAMA